LNDTKAYRYYSRLISLGTKQDISITLADVAALLCTTPRHARTLLQTLQQLNWLTWMPKVGRNQRSLLYLNYALSELQNQLAEQQIALGNYEKALVMLEGDQQQFNLLLQKTSGATRREGQLHIQLTYPRIFNPLLPHQPLRNSERFLVRQIYACLTACDNSGNVQAQLAHHWQCNDDATEWRFYLRPQLKFHSTEPIDAQQISELFNQLQMLPEYKKELSHVENVYALQQCIIFELASPDLGFAALLSDLRYSIQPTSQVNDVSHTQVVGTGAFQVIEHCNKRLRLQAFDNYFSLRALTDTVTIWQLKNTSNERIKLDKYPQEHNSKYNSEYPQTDKLHLQESSQSRIENGCLYLLFNQGHGKTPLSAVQRKYLSQTLSAELILQEPDLSGLLRAAVPAFNLLPCWTKVLSTKALSNTVLANTADPADLITSTELPKRLNIAAFDHLVILDCANALSKKLNQMGIESHVTVYSFLDMHEKSAHQQLQEDIIIGSINVDDNLPVSVFRWLYADSILHQGLSSHAKNWLNKELVMIRETKTVDSYLTALESLATTMIYENWLTPLFHHRQTLQWGDILQGVSITDWSWPDFKNVWTDK